MDAEVVPQCRAPCSELKSGLEEKSGDLFEPIGCFESSWAKLGSTDSVRMRRNTFQIHIFIA
jgi:hypothetical protein